MLDVQRRHAAPIDNGRHYVTRGVMCDPGRVPDNRERDIPARPFPREAYVFGWLVICVVAAEGIYSLLTGVLGTGIILIGLIPFMVWLMYFRPRRHAMGKRRS